MKRHGKITRLPKQLLNTLNERLEAGAQGKELVDWLNSVKEVKKLLKDHFNEIPISEQNLSEWRTGGFKDWQRQQETKERIDAFLSSSEPAEEIRDERNHAVDLQDRLSKLLTAELACAIQQLLADDTIDTIQRLKHIQAAARTLIALRKSDNAAHQESRETQHASERETEKADRQEHQRKEQEELHSSTSFIWDLYHRNTFAQWFGGGMLGRETATFLFNEKRRVKGESPLPPMPIPENEPAKAAAAAQPKEPYQPVPTDPDQDFPEIDPRDILL